MQTSRALIGFLRVLLPVAVLAGAGAAAYMMIVSRPTVVTEPPAITPPGVRVHQVSLDKVQIVVRSQGTVRPRTESQIVPEISGRVVAVAPSFAEGGFFETGDLLVSIDPFDYQRAIITARSQLAQARLRLAQEQAEAEVARREWEDLGRGDPQELTLRKPQLEEARAAVAAAEAGLERAERDLQRAEIRAPYAGRVRRKNVDVGQFVTIGNPIATIYAVDAAEVRLPLPNEELAYLDLPLAYRDTRGRPGPQVTLSTTFAGASYTWHGRIVRTESELDPATRMVHVVAEVRDPYAAGGGATRPPLAVGMFVDADIEGREFGNVAVIPRAALQGRDRVLVVDDDERIRFRTIDVLRATTEALYVREGLTGGDRVVVSALDAPVDGMLVQVTGEEAHTPSGGVTHPEVSRSTGHQPAAQVPPAPVARPALFDREGPALPDLTDRTPRQE